MRNRTLPARGSGFDFNLGSDMNAKGKVALLTGGARIGQVVAQSLAARKCDLAPVYRASIGRIAWIAVARGGVLLLDR